MTAVPRTSPKNARKPQRHTRLLWQAIAQVTADYEHVTIRQLFYQQLVARGVVPKTEGAYKRVADATAQMRLADVLPYRAIVDGHRVRRGVFAHDGIGDALADTHALYRRNYWRAQPVTVEVWSEKDALTGVIQPVAGAHGVTYVATRGFPSITLIYESAQSLIATGKPAVIFYFGDHDASGQQISATLEAQLRAHGADVTVQRIALNPDQIAAYHLSTRPGKASDSRQAAFRARFGDASVELDTLPPDVLRRLVEGAIDMVIDWEEWARMQTVEALERRTLASLAARYE